MDIIPNPKTSIILDAIPGDPTSTYINANYVRGADGNMRRYIAAMGFV